jgi:hypothetical protein
MPAEYGGRIEKLACGKLQGTASTRAVEESDTEKKVPIVLGGSIKSITKRRSRKKRWFYDDKNNPLHVRQWVYEVILSAAVLVLLSSFLVIVISSVRRGKLDLPSFLAATGTFLGGLGIGYGYGTRRDGKRHNSRPDADEEQQNEAGDDTS